MTDNESIVLYAFEFALGKRSYAVKEVSDYIITNKSELSENTRKIIIKKINEAIDLRKAGDMMDEEVWENVVNELMD